MITVELKIDARFNHINELGGSAIRGFLLKTNQLKELMEDLRDSITGERVKVTGDVTTKGAMLYINCSDSIRAEA
jgi:hypothetical protein